MSVSEIPDVMAPARARIESTPWLGLGLTGILAFVTGYALVGALSFVGSPPTERGIAVGLRTIGFAFYGAHGIMVDAGGVRLDFLARTGGEVPVVAYYAVPIVVLLATGILAQRRYGHGGLDPVGTLLTVVGVATGYVLVAALGTFVFVTTTLGGATAAFPLVDASVLAGLYALVFGFVGAAGASAVDVYL